MKSPRIALAACAVFALVACDSSQGQKQTAGSLIGAGLGALAGSQVGGGTGQLAAVAIGSLAGAYVGSEVGKSLDRADQAAMERTSQKALEKNKSGQPSTWQNPDSGHSGSVTPTKTYQTASGENCREYRQSVTIDGRTQTAYGKACRQPDGSWRIVN